MNQLQKHVLAAMGLLVKLSGVAFAGYSINAINANWTANTVIPAGNLVGITESQTFNNLQPGSLASVSVNLDITGGYNGDLYAFLAFQDADGEEATEVLLNQVGTSADDFFGSAAAGFNNITLSDAGTVNGSIHGATGIPTGLWQPDSVNSFAQTFGGLKTADGTYTLFLASLDSGLTPPTLVSWGLNINVAPAPEPGQVVAMAMLGLATLGAVGYRRLARREAVLAGK